MFEVFEPLIRRNCGKIFALAGVGAFSVAILAYQVMSSVIHYITHII